MPHLRSSNASQYGLAPEMIPRHQLEELHPQRIVDEKKVPRRTNHLRTEADGGKETPENLVAALQATKHPPRLLDATSAEYPS